MPYYLFAASSIIAFALTTQRVPLGAYIVTNDQSSAVSPYFNLERRIPVSCRNCGKRYETACPYCTDPSGSDDDRDEVREDEYEGNDEHENHGGTHHHQDSTHYDNDQEEGTHDNEHYENGNQDGVTHYDSEYDGNHCDESGNNPDCDYDNEYNGYDDNQQYDDGDYYD